MPFDGTTTKGTKAVIVINEMIKRFGDDGELWEHGGWGNSGHHCLVGMMLSVQRKLHIDRDHTVDYLVHAVEDRLCLAADARWWHRQGPWNKLITYNDQVAQRYRQDIRPVLLHARDLAVQDI